MARIIREYLSLFLWQQNRNLKLNGQSEKRTWSPSSNEGETWEKGCGELQMLLMVELRLKIKWEQEYEWNDLDVCSVHAEMKQHKSGGKGENRKQNQRWQLRVKGYHLKAEKASSWYVDIFTKINAKILLLAKIMQLNYQWRGDNVDEFNCSL